MPVTVIVRVLFLDGGPEKFPKKLIERLYNLKLYVTYEGQNNTIDHRGIYCVSDASLALARKASTDEYNVIIIGNNVGTGRAKAEALPDEVMDITMISFNHRTPAAEIGYLGCGFKNIGTRLMTRRGELDVPTFINQRAREMTAV